MPGNARRSIGVRAPILFISAIAWMMLLVNPGSMIALIHCPVTTSWASPMSFKMLVEMNPLSSLAEGWALMLVAMMAPTLTAPVRYILERSFKRRRARSVALFFIGYGAVWMVAGAVLLSTELLLSLLAPRSLLPAIMVGVVAFVWQCAPAKQRCLNRGHNHYALAAFGLDADLDVFRFGMKHGVWCVGSCWALMLFPMLLPVGHFAGMAAVTFQVVSERLEQPRPPDWRLRGPVKLVRILVQQARMGIQGTITGSAVLPTALNPRR